MAHLNNGKCPHCAEIFDKYPGFHPGIRAWFEALQKKQPMAHISCAGRGQTDQELFFRQGTSKAHYGQSAHNFNAAVDIFRLTLTGADYNRDFFRDVVGGAVTTHNANPNNFILTWFGFPHSPYFELPHVELANWKELSLAAELKLVEIPNAEPLCNTKKQS